MLGALTAARDAQRADATTDAALGIPLDWLARLSGFAGGAHDVSMLTGA